MGIFSTRNSLTSLRFFTLLSSKGLLVMRAASSLFPVIFWKLTSTLTNFLNNLIGFFFENFLIYWLEFRFNMFAKIILVEGSFFLFFFKFADLYLSFSFKSLVFLLIFFRSFLFNCIFIDFILGFYSFLPNLDLSEEISSQFPCFISEAVFASLSLPSPFLASASRFVVVKLVETPQEEASVSSLFLNIFIYIFLDAFILLSSVYVALVEVEKRQNYKKYASPR